VQQVAFPGSLAGGFLGELRRAPRMAFIWRLGAFLAGPRYDAELADGISPTTSLRHAARAGQITRRRACRRVAQALKGAVEATEHPSTPHRLLDTKVPIDYGAVRVCKDELLSLADSLAATKRPSARGVAIARQLVFDGCSPLYLQAPPHRHGSERRLASTLYAAARALEISADFD
jgi:hypothetical protein